MNSARFRRLTDLFVVGRALPLSDGTYLWVQVLNSYQRDECISDAQTARARFVMALRHEGAEKEKIEARFYEFGREKSLNDLAENKMQAKASEFIDDLRADEEWKERLDILLRSNPDDTAVPMDTSELVLLARINDEVMVELRKREDDERAYQRSKLASFSDEEIIDEWTEYWLDQRGSSLATAEFALSEVAYSARYCNAVKNLDTEELDHSACEAHGERVFDSREAVRGAPGELVSLLRSTLADLNLVGRDPKDSASPENSSGSSPTPSEAEASTPSTSTPTPAPPPGT